MRRITESRFSDAFQEEAGKRDRLLGRRLRAIRKSPWGRIAVEQHIVDLAKDHNVADFLGDDDGRERDWKSFFEALGDFLAKIFSEEGLAVLKTFLDIVLEFIKSLMSLASTTEAVDALVVFEAELFSIETEEAARAA